ncbi:MAG: CHAT domain-containing protein, partial [Acidobacteria bacterium]|nr:CHAT domain-containing protein [Acidobacteriota bacterium]
WLGDLTAVALQPAGARSLPLQPAAPPAPYVFVVDPLGDLPYADRSAAAYRKTFPGARILRRSAASRRAVEELLARADGLHVDAHAVYEAAFPELSSLQLADGGLRFLELAALRPPRRFANLSGCRTGSWFATADSGRYGFGGLMARLGVPWTVATRAPLLDRLAEDYNETFYLAIAGGSEPPEVHRQALARVSARYPAAAWASLLLLHAPPVGEGLEDTPELRKIAHLDSRWSEGP